MKMSISKLLFIHLTILLTLLSFVHSQSQCRLSRFPQVIPMLYGQQATINLQEYVTGTNITFTVEPNDFYANIRLQYSCKWLWNRQLGKISATEYYEVKQDNRTDQFVAMLGGSAYFEDLYLVYYGVNVSQIQMGGESEAKEEILSTEDQQPLLGDSFQVLEVPRSLLKSCKSFTVLSNNTHLQFILDCISLSNPLNKMLTSTTVLISTAPPSSTWQHIQSPIYFPRDIIPKLQTLRSHISVIDAGKGTRYLLRTIMSEYEDYIEVWRWVDGAKEIIGLYDYTFFVLQDDFPGDDIDIRMVQVVSNTILILDLMNGLHILRLNKLGQLLYSSTLQLQAFTSFHYDPKQLILFMGKRGQVQQYEISLLSQTSIKATRIQRYHLFGFEEIKQITTQNRFLYVSTQSYIHVVHLTNILSNNQQYDGSYKVYPQLYVQKLIPTDIGFVKVVGFESIVQISTCETHPPFLHLKAPKMSTNFTVHATSTINHQSTLCSMALSSVMVTADDDKIYLNGYEAESETIFSNRPGRTLVELDKYGIGKNLEYELVTFNHKIPFQHKFRKTNTMACEFVKSSAQGNKKDLETQEHLLSKQSIQASPLVKTSSVGTWLIAQYPQKRVKQYYKCFKYQKIQCKFIHLSIVPTNSPVSAYQQIVQERTKKEYLHEAISYQLTNQTVIEVSLISGNGSKNVTVQGKGKENEENLKVQSLLCKVKYLPGAQYQVSQFQLRQDKLYIVLPHLKQIRIYQALLSFEQDSSCHYFGTISLQSFKHPSIYFSPQHIDFDKQALNLPYLVPSNTFSSYQNLKLITETSQVLFISQFSEILVVRVIIGREAISKIELLKTVIIDRLREGDEVNLMVTLPYVLAINKQQKVIAQYYLTHTFDSYFIRMLDFYPDNTTLSLNNVRLVDSNTLAVMTAPDAQNQTSVQIYILNSIVSSFKDFAKWKVSSTFLVMQFVDDEYEFVTTKFQQSTTSLQMYCNSTTLTPSPFLLIDVPKRNNSDQPSKEQFYLRIQTESQLKRHVMTLEVASDSSDILKGVDYPYRTLRIKLQQDQQQAYVEINDMKWFEGNIWRQRYVCNDCRTGRIRFEDKVALQSTIELQAFNIPNDFYVHKEISTSDDLESYSFQIIEGYLHTRLTPQDQNQTWLLPSQMIPEYDIQTANHNITYTFSQSTLLSSNTQNNPSCIKASPTGHQTYFASLCDDYEYLDDSAVLQLRLYSNHGFKPFVINQYFIEISLLSHQYQTSFRSGTKSLKQLIILSPPQPTEDDPSPKYDTLFVRFDDNIWVFLIINGKLELIYTVDRVDFGGDHLCWMEVVQKSVNVDVGKSQLQYGITASMCETGLYYIVFTVDSPKSSGLSTQKQPLPSFHRLSQQQIDMQAQLQKNKIQLPQHSYFLQTIIKPSTQPRSLFLYTIVQNFNSFIWKVTLLRQSIAISSIELVGVIRRYNEYSPIQVTSNDQRYFSVLYKSTQNMNASEFLAVYDLNHFTFNKEKDINEYSMFSVQETNQSPVYQNKSEVFQIGTNLFLLNQNQIKIFNVTNMIRMHIQKQFPPLKQEQQQLQPQTIRNNLLTDSQDPVLYSQSIIIFVQTPTQVNSATIKLDSVDFFELSDWEIVFIVLGGLIVLVILYYVSKEVWKFVQKRRRLVRLEADSMDDRSSEKVSEEGRNSKEDVERDEMEQEQEEQSGRNIHDRNSQITTSDSHSILQRGEIQQPIIPNRQSQITTSDFSHSILEKGDLQKPLLDQQK